MRSIAVMQPYTFPYFGYFQLITAVDTFVFFDDVQYIRRGFINRNNILNNKKPYTFTIPVQKASRETPINHIQLHKENYPIWEKAFLKTLQNNYKQAPNFTEIFSLVKTVLAKSENRIDTLAKNSIIETLQYLNVEKEIVSSSNLNYNRLGSGEDKVLSICELLKAEKYINPPGGKKLYNSNTFSDKQIELLFLEPLWPEYNQNNQDFVPNLSFIDTLMFVEKEEITSLLNTYQLKIPTT